MSCFHSAVAALQSTSLLLSTSVAVFLSPPPPSKCCSLPLKINHKYPERRLLVAESCGALAPYLPVRTFCAHRIKTGFGGTNKTRLELTVSVRPTSCACRRRSVAPWCCPCCSRCSLRIRLTWSGRPWSRVWVSSWVTLMTLTSIPRYVCPDRKAVLFLVLVIVS